MRHAQRSYQPAIKANNCFIAEDKRINGREPLDQAGRDHVEPQRWQTTDECMNNRFITEDGTRSETEP